MLVEYHREITGNAYSRWGLSNIILQINIYYKICQPLGCDTVWPFKEIAISELLVIVTLFPDSFHPDDGGDMFPLRAGSYKNDTTSHPKR
jgi:hypothetical protein